MENVLDQISRIGQKDFKFLSVKYIYSLSSFSFWIFLKVKFLFFIFQIIFSYRFLSLGRERICTIWMASGNLFSVLFQKNIFLFLGHPCFDHEKNPFSGWSIIRNNHRWLSLAPGQRRYDSVSYSYWHLADFATLYFANQIFLAFDK